MVDSCYSNSGHFSSYLLHHDCKKNRDRWKLVEIDGLKVKDWYDLCSSLIKFLILSTKPQSNFAWYDPYFPMCLDSRGRGTESYLHRKLHYCLGLDIVFQNVFGVSETFASDISSVILEKSWSSMQWNMNSRSAFRPAMPAVLKVLKNFFKMMSALVHRLTDSHNLKNRFGVLSILFLCWDS